MAYRIAAVLVLLACASPTFGESWTTSDGVISVEKPDSSRFVEIDRTEGLSMVWLPAEGAMRLAVVEVPLPPGTRLRQSGVEAGLAKEFGGEIIESRIRQDGPSTIMLMTALAEVKGQKTYMSQAIVAVGDKAYKAMVAGLGEDPRTNPDAVAFLDSFRVLKHETPQAAHQAPSGSANARNRRDSKRSLTDELSQRIGGISGMLLIVALLLLAVFRSKRKANH